LYLLLAIAPTLLASEGQNIWHPACTQAKVSFSEKIEEGGNKVVFPLSSEVCKNKKSQRASLQSGFFSVTMVPEAGLEPAWIIHPRDFESTLSRSFLGTFKDNILIPFPLPPSSLR
jgi:hypothetical protein